MNARLRFMSCLAAVLVPVVSFAFGLPKAPSVGGGGTLSAAMIDSFTQKAITSDVAMNAAAESLFNAVASKEQREAHEAALKAANALTDPKEKDAAIKKEMASLNAVIAQNTNDEATVSRIAALDDQQRGAVGAAAQGFLIAAASNVGLVRQGQELAKQKPELSAATKVPELTASLASLVGQAKGAVGVATGLQKLAKSAKIELPADAVSSAISFN